MSAGTYSGPVSARRPQERATPHKARIDTHSPGPPRLLIGRHFAPDLAVDLEPFSRGLGCFCFIHSVRLGISPHVQLHHATTPFRGQSPRPTPILEPPQYANRAPDPPCPRFPGRRPVGRPAPLFPASSASLTGALHGDLGRCGNLDIPGRAVPPRWQPGSTHPCQVPQFFADKIPSPASASRGHRPHR